MAEGPAFLDLNELTSRRGRYGSLTDIIKYVQLSPMLEIKRLTLEPDAIHSRSGKYSKLKIKKENERGRYLNNQSKATVYPTIVAERKENYLRSKSPTILASRLGMVKKPMEVIFPDKFPAVASTRSEHSPSPSTYSRNSSQNSELLPVFYMQSMVPEKYLHKCMPIRYHLKNYSLSINATGDQSKLFGGLHCLHPVSQPSQSSQNKGTSKDNSEVIKMSRPPLSSSIRHPTTKILKKTPHKLIPIANLSIKGIPKELDVVSICDRLPIIYNKQYNLRYLRAMKRCNLNEIMLPDKPARVYSILEAKLYKVMLNECAEWEAMDITSVFDITKYIPNAIKKFDIVNVARIMKVDCYDVIPNWDDFDLALLFPLRIQMMGSIVACKLATDFGWAVNIGGGLCHNTAQFGKGLGAYDDVLVCLTIASKFPKVNHILVIDCDAYQSSNYKYVEDISCKITILDFYFKPFYQSAINQPRRSPNGRVEYYGYKFDRGIADHYLSKLRDLLPGYLEDPSKPQPSLCIYIAGTNILDRDIPVSFTAKNVVTRDQIVFRTLYISHGIPVATLLGGGYQQYDVEAAAASICQICRTVHTKKRSKYGSNHSSN